MKPSFLSVNGVPAFVVAVGVGGRIRHLVLAGFEPQWLDLSAEVACFEGWG